jgi:YbbR domain-containing protein
MTENIEIPIEVCDASGKKLDSPYLKTDVQTAVMTIPILKKKVLPIHFDFVDVPTDFDISTIEYTITPSEIEVAGPPTVINGMTELHLGYVDLRSVEPGVRFFYSAALPDDVMSVDNITEVNVQFGNEGFISKSLNTSDLRLINVPSDYNVSFATKMLYGVKIYGPEGEIEKLTGKDIVAQVDMTDVDIRLGQITVPVRILVPTSESCWAFGDEYTAVITVVKGK